MTGLKRSAVLTAVVAFFALLFAVPAAAVPNSYDRTPTLSLSTQSAREGQTITVSGTDFIANSQISLTLHSKSYALGSATANGSGSFSRSVSLPSGVLGDHTITGSGPGTNNTASASLTISASGDEGAGAGSGGSGSGGSGAGGASGGLPNTGVAVIGIGALGLVLLAGGGAMLFAGRRRRVSA